MAREPSVSRRRWLVTGGTALAAGLAGCTGGDDGDGSDDAGEGSDGSGDGGEETTGGASVDPGSVSATGDWPMLRYDAAGNSYAPDRSGPDATAGELWSFEDVSSENVLVPVVSDGTVLAQTSSGTCLALDAASGAEQWRTDLSEAGSHRLPFGLAVDGDVLYAGGETVYALDVESGDTLWEAPDASAEERLAFADGRVYACAPDGVVALDAESGDQLWVGETGDRVSFLSVGEGGVYTLDWDTVVTAFDPDGGDQLWDYELEGSTLEGLTASGDSVYVVDGEEQELVSLGAGDGSVEWRTDTGCIYHPTVTDDTLYVATFSSVEAYDPGTGEERSDWTSPVDVAPWTSPVITDSRGYTLTGSLDDGVEDLRAFDSAAGGAAWSTSVPTELVNSVVVLEDVLLYGTEDRIVAMA